MSIRVRLTLWYAGSVLALFLATGLLLRVALHQTLEGEFGRGVERTAELVQGFFRVEVAEYGGVATTVEHIAGEIVFPDQRVEFLRPDGRVHVASLIAAGAHAGELAPPIHHVERPLDRALAPGWSARVSASGAALVSGLRRIDRALLLVVPLTVLLAGTLGWWIAGRTLRPVGAMAAAAERITAADAHGRIPVGNPRDELGRLAGHFNALLERLDGALTQQRRFLADAAHELRTPVARMLSQVERGLAGAPTADPHTEVLRQVRGDLLGTAALIDMLLQLARADAGEPAPRLEDGFLDDAVAEAIQPWYAVAERAGITLELTELREAAAHLHPDLVGRLLGILLDNSIRYTPRGGRVRVRVAGEPAGAVLEVEDTGIGILEEERARLNERFFRGRQARRLAPEGSGLGLAIAAWIVAQHGGRLELLPAAGGGTRARVVLPVSPVPAPSPAPHPSATAGSGRS
jgi:two-component system, OmpR family, sensor kinase